MKTRILTGIVVILTLAFSITTLPTAHADIVPAPGTTIETQWIPSGPASDGIQLNFYGDMNAQDNALLAGQIDLTDTPISAFANPFFCAPGTAFWCTPPSGPNACPSGQFAWAKGWQSVSVDSTACIDNFFTLLNMWNPNPAIFGPEIRWGSVGGTDTLNPYLAASQQDFHVLGEVYDTLLRANPYDHSQIFSWMAASNGFVAPGSNGGLCPANANECLQMSLRGDIFSHDAFQMTASDVKFSYLTLNAAGASKGSCLGANNVVDVSFDPAVLPTSLGGTEFVGQSETLYVVFSAPPSSMSCFEQVPILPQHVWQTASSTGPCMTAGTSQCQVDTNYLSPGPCSDPAIVASSCTTSTGMIPAPSLVGSGPFVCASGPLGGAGTVVGQGCTSTGSSSVSAGGQIVLSRFGSGATLNTAYFRDNAKYLQWQWANLDQNVAVDLFDINIARSCASATPPLTGACLHYDTSASTLLCNSSAGPCILQNVGGDNDGRVGGLDLSQVLRWFGVSWMSPLTYCSVIPSGAIPYPQVLHDDGVTYSQMPYFALTANPLSIDFVPHAPGTFMSSITALSALGFTGTVSLSPPTVTPNVGSGTPTATVTMLSNGGSLTSCQSDMATLTVNVFSNTPYHTYTVVVSGSGFSVPVTLHPPDFSISATPVSSIPQGSSGTSSVTVTSLHSFTGGVKVTSAVTAGPSCSGSKCPAPSPKSVTLTLTASGSGSTQSFTLTVSTISTTPKGTYTITITGTSTNSSNVPGQIRSTTFSVTVT